MKMKHHAVVALVLVFCVMSCSDEEGVETAGPLPEKITVEGVITSKDDQVPVDGGVSMGLELDNGETETLLFGSLFTDPPPSQEHLDLYQVILAVNIGDRVIASGQLAEGGVILETLRVLGRE